MLPQWMSRSSASAISQNTSEKTKIILSSSFLRAIAHTHVHLWPIITSVAIIVINLNGRFIGVDFEGPIKYQGINTLLLQVTAKLHEVLVVISLGAIVSNIIRTELLSDDGLSFGLISSVLSFNNAIYFISKEFFGSFRTNCRAGRRWKGISIVVVLLCAGAIALLVGPSSASLLVPKDQYWHSAATTFYVNGSWTPFNLTDTLPDIRRFCNTSTSIDLAICPAAGYVSLLDYWGCTNSTTFANQGIPTYSADLSGARYRWPVNGRGLGTPSLNAVSNPRFIGKVRPSDSTFVIQPPLGATTILQRIATDWWSALSDKMGSRVKEVNDRKIVSQMYNPITYIRCAPPQNLSASDKTVNFPAMRGRFDFGDPKSVTVPFLNGNSTEALRFDWFMLPDGFGAVSLGAIFQSPWPKGGLSRTVLGCSLQSGYVSANVNTDQYSFWTGWYTSAVDWGSRIPDYIPTPGQPLSPTNGRVLFDNEWLSLLTPPVRALPNTNSSSVSTIEQMLEAASVYKMDSPQVPMTETEQWNDLNLKGQGPTPLLESIIGSVIVDGLSRVSSYKIFNTTGPSAEWSLGMYNLLPDWKTRLLSSKDVFETPQADSSDYVTLYADVSISGLNYQKGLATYLAISVLIAHMAMVLGHAIMLSYQKRTSNSWSLPTEMLALAQNSRPAYKTLKNTGGGIKLARTMGAVAKIRVRQNPHQPDIYDHVELVFDDEDVVHNQIQANSQQGSMAHSLPVEVLTGTASHNSGSSLGVVPQGTSQAEKSAAIANLDDGSGSTVTVNNAMAPSANSAIAMSNPIAVVNPAAATPTPTAATPTIVVTNTATTATVVSSSQTVASTVVGRIHVGRYYS